MDIIYIDNYAQAEEAILRGRELEVSSLDKARHKASSVVLRGPKMKASEYRLLINDLAARDIHVSTDENSYTSLSNSEIYEQNIKENVPVKRTFSNLSKSELKHNLLQLSSWGEIFIRSELGSAAKTAGIDACIIKTFEHDEIESKLEALFEAYPNFERLIARRVEKVRLENARRAEGRFIVIRGTVQYLDYCELDSEDSWRDFDRRNMPNAIVIVSNLSAAGIAGDYFLDIAEKEHSGWFVVEIKPLLNGTIRNVDMFATSLIRSRIG